jgi:hypothetical protein
VYGGPPVETRLELLAIEAGLHPWQLREWLREELERRAVATNGDRGKPHRDHTASAFSSVYGKDNPLVEPKWLA